MRKAFLSVSYCLLSLISAKAFCQDSRREYLVYTFENYYSLSPHDKRIYYWVQPVDSIKEGTHSLKVLFLAGFSTSDVADCCNGRSINPFAVTANSDYNFDNIHYQRIDTIKSLINTYKKKIQTIRKQWTGGQREVINIFVTPIKGVLCSSNFLQVGLYATDYRGRIYIPLSMFSYQHDFWTKHQEGLFLKEDYSKVLFSIFPAIN